MTVCPKLSEPVIVHQAWLNRRHDALVVTLSTFKDQNLIDVRKHAMNREGKLVPTAKGIAMKVTRLPDLLKGITKAIEKARELGLIDGDEVAE
ncbi:transcriptional coactivator p15/PC4 family protein [Bradyrhizobium sp. ISRA443]|uniref:transcriptional coactivator p15/PC4 family protein n=1 Tax=unclassified Bradyrhizobium TaxID=2631580 RepID=UPI00247A8C65|nr:MULTISPECIES: transcriptional coactivator p15/PC4 family protein [unclassified Bradyrhizobium]WGR91848.1 transcriptional coactivator p15/PC4 family protein [Bradyrhizobium sp. ISRA435]WGS02215.1 transcriptional coactivator p15/PC4 family protein [Bradyrhizobium sp. ISRA436]WGS09100.1 transcriptional coactivator p15/PC4 family protein [Bradyrhizobium sp. ISRA437]WGS15989.1 transcriptional coactivator p15/PC4 family protein [Bradyrhizobium sp. ISRA443]